jgi:hypothetical protein
MAKNLQKVLSETKAAPVLRSVYPLASGFEGTQMGEYLTANPPMAMANVLWSNQFEDEDGFAAPVPPRGFCPETFFGSFFTAEELAGANSNAPAEKPEAGTSPYGAESSLVYDEDGFIPVETLDQMCEISLRLRREGENAGEERSTTEDEQEAMVAFFRERALAQGADSYEIRRAEMDLLWQEAMSNVQTEFLVVSDCDGYLTPIIPDYWLTMPGIPGNEYLGEFGDPHVDPEVAYKHFEDMWGAGRYHEEEGDHHHHNEPLYKPHRWDAFGYPFFYLSLLLVLVPSMCLAIYFRTMRKFMSA